MTAIVGITGSRTVDSQSPAVAWSTTTELSASGAATAGVCGTQFVSGAVTVAVFGTRPLGSMAVAGNGSAACVTMLNVMTAPGASVAVEQVTTWAALAVQPVGDETNVRPAGSGSVTTMLFAVASDTFVTVKEYGTVDPGTICVTLDDLLRVISAG